MIHPRPEALIATIIESIDVVLRPGLEEALRQAPEERRSQAKLHLSTVVTMRHLLRFVQERLARDPVELPDEAVLLDDLLLDLRDFAGNPRSEIAAPPASLMSVSSSSAPDTGADLHGRVAAQRRTLSDALVWLIDNRETLKTEPAYSLKRHAIRDYLTWQMDNESRAVDAAFEGPDFRR